MINFFMNIMRSGGNPETILMRMLQEQNSPITKNLLGLAKNGDTVAIERVARNLCQQRGIDFDKEFKAFKEQFGFK